MHPGEAADGADPEIAGRIAHDREDEVRREALLLRERRPLALSSVEAREPALGSGPDVARAILVQRPYAVRRQAVLLGVDGPGGVRAGEARRVGSAPAREAGTASPHPEVAVRRLEGRAHVVRREAFERSGRKEGSGGEARESAVAADPEIAVIVGRERLHGVVGQALGLRERGDPAVRDAVEAAGDGAGPEDAVLVASERDDFVVLEAVGGRRGP